MPPRKKGGKNGKVAKKKDPHFIEDEGARKVFAATGLMTVKEQNRKKFTATKLQESSVEYKTIMNYISNTTGGLQVDVESILKVNTNILQPRPKTSVGNDWWLFHGTLKQRVPQILKNGMQIKKKHVITEKNSLGLATYFGERFETSDDYTTLAHRGKERGSGPRNVRRYMFLCRVSLGKVHLITEKDSTLARPASDCNSVKCEGRWTHLRTVQFDNAKIPMDLRDTKRVDGPNETEYAIYDANQIEPTYLIVYKYK